MTQEEKAKAYDEAVKLIKDNLDALNKIAGTGAFVVNIQSIRNCFYRAFPELNESEDERIRKALVDALNKNLGNGIEKYGTTLSAALAWLEKQGEQKPADKVEPKFKVGDWIVDNNVKTPLLITGISNEKYDVISIYGNDMAFSFREVEHFYHLWTIADAKEGDVLAFDNDTIVIFKDLYNSTTFHSYCHIEDGVFDVSEDNLPDWWEGKGFYPATKEQRDLLFQKMKMTWEIFGMPKIG